MKLEDLDTNQIVAVVKFHNGLHVGLTGVVIGYSEERKQALVKFNNKHKTEEYIPIIKLIGIVM